LLTFEEMITFLTQIEACLNSRPLTPLSSDPNDLNPLTPGHFLIGESPSTILEPDLTALNANRLSRWRRIQQMVQSFWQRWSTEYLSTLQKRSKWTSPSTNVTLGTMVLLREDHTPPLNWTLGRIVDVHPGSDNIVRVVSVKTTRGIFKRSTTKICPLPFEENEVSKASSIT